MDLVATVTEKQTVDVWRFNGQRVFGLTSEGEDETPIAGLAWRTDGQLLAVTRSDGVTQLINSFSGKIAHRLRPSSLAPSEGSSFSSSVNSTKSSAASPTRRVSSLSWTTHFPNAGQTRRSLEATAPSVLLDDLLGLNADISKLLKTKADLPRELANIDIETSLPKLSSLPVTGADDDVFSTRNSIDSIFHSQNAANGQGRGRGETVEVLVTGFSGTTMNIHIFDSFEIGRIDISNAIQKGFKGKRVVHHTGHPFLSMLFVVVEAEPDKTRRTSLKSQDARSTFHLVSLDLRFVPQTSHNLPLLATKATQLQNLLRYLSQIQRQMAQELKASFELPRKFIRNVNESLVEHDPSATFTSAAYHLVVTGVCDPRLKEWLVEEVGERGLKRWEKAVGDCLGTVRRMTSECLLPALERCQVVLSRLDGLARFAGTSTRLGLDEKSIKAVRDTIDALNILGEDLLRDVCVEIREFAAFMRWLKWEAEVEALDEGSERAEELRETFAGESELRTVLGYASGPLRESRVLRYINTEAKDTDGTPISAANGDSDFYTSYKKSRNSTTKEKQLPKLDQLLSRLENRSEKIFARIAETLRENILSSYITELPSEMHEEIMDIRIVPSTDEARTYFIHAVAKLRNDATKMAYVVLRMNDDPAQGLRNVHQKLHGMQLSSAAPILDIKFADDDGIIVLVEISDKESDERQLLWHATAVGGRSDFAKNEWEVRHIFENGEMKAGMHPARLEVNGRKGRRAVAVLDEAGMGFVVLDLDSGLEGSEEGEGDEVMSG